MNAFAQFVARLRGVFQNRRLDAEMREEMRGHLERRTAANVAAGMSLDEASYAAQRQFGGVEQIKEIAREQRGWFWLEDFFRDGRHAVRQLAKAPGFTGVAILTLALAIGVNSAVFSLVDAVLLRPAVSLRPEELVNLFNGRQAAKRDFRLFSHAEYLALRETKDTFADVAATSIATAGLEGEEGVRKVQAFFTSENYFAMLGTQPELGRFYTAEEARPNANVPVIVTSHDLWQRRGGRPDFVGSKLLVNGKPYTVIGVAPAAFNGVLVFGRIDLWVPLGAFGEFTAGLRSDLALPRTQRLNLTARLARGVTLASLASRLPLVSRYLTALQVDPGEGPRELFAEPPSRGNVSTQPSGGDAAVPLALGVFSMSGCVLLVACLNLANMLLARGANRSKEIAVRLALGAGRGRVVRQLFVEGLVLAFVGGAAGLLLGSWGNRLLIDSLGTLMSAAGESLILHVGPDARVLGTTFLISLVATLVFSLGPALKTSRPDLVHSLKQDGSESQLTGRLHRFFSLSHCLVMGQIALSFVLLFAAGLFMRGALKVAAVEPGFAPAGAVVADMDYSLTPLSPDDARRSLFSTLERLSSRAEISSVAAANFVPYSTRSEGSSARPAGNNDPAFNFSVTFTAVTDHYFAAAGIRLVRGRDFTASEARDPLALVAIIDTGLAQKLFPSSDALGQRIRVNSVEREIVGLCAPHRQSNRRPELPARVFIPYAAGKDTRAFVVVRSARLDGAGTSEAVGWLRTALRTLDPELPVVNVATFSSLLENDFTIWLARIGAVLFGLFGAIALLLAVVGVYGVKAYAVSRRTREIGIRMAVGAEARDVVRLLLRQGAAQVVVALGGGLILSFAAGKVLAKMLYQVSPSDPVALFPAAAILGTVALFACWIPARRATKIDPVSALRSE